MEVVDTKQDVRLDYGGFYIAVMNAMSEIPMFEKKNKVSFGKTKYSFIKLEEINAVIKPILNKHRLFITHKVENGFLTTSLVHADSKDGMVSHFKIDSNDPQKIGSLMTYGRRYNTCALLNIDCAGEDDDCVQLYNNRNETPNAELSVKELCGKIQNLLSSKDDEYEMKFMAKVEAKYGAISGFEQIGQEELASMCNSLKI